MKITKEQHISHGLIGCSPGSIGRYVLLPGDPSRVPMIAELFEDAKEVSRTREFCAYTGTLQGEMVSAVSTGMGGPSTAITVQELAQLGAQVMIRVGTSGTMQKFMEATDLVITWGAVRDEYTSQQFLPLSYPAVADTDVTLPYPPPQPNWDTGIISVFRKQRMLFTRSTSRSVCLLSIHWNRTGLPGVKQVCCALRWKLPSYLSPPTCLA